MLLDLCLLTYLSKLFDARHVICMNQKLKKKDLDRTGDVGIEDSVVIAIHSHKRDGVCQSYFGVRICAEEELETVNFATQ